MIGRYGPDSLFYGLFALYAILRIVCAFVWFLPLELLSFAVVVFMFYRFFSRNIAKRQKENLWFRMLIGKFKNMKTADRTRVFRKCPKCKTKLRLPRRPGKHTVQCPKCGNEFKVRIW